MTKVFFMIGNTLFGDIRRIFRNHGPTSTAKLSISFMLLFLVTFSGFPLSWAGTHYVTPNGAGAKNGTSWSNAYSGNEIWHGEYLSMVRGDTYVFSGGIYTQGRMYSSDTGTTPITVRKATAAECAGGPSGCTDQAVWDDAPIELAASYLEIDGVTGSGNNFASYGIKVKFNLSQTNGMGMAGWSSNYSSVGHVTLKHIYLESPTPNDPLVGFMVPSNSSLISCATHFVMRPVITNRSTNVIIDGNWFERNLVFWHGDGIFNDNGVGIDITQNNIVRNNVFKDISGTCVICICMGGTCRGWQIYNNVFFHDPTWNGMPYEIAYNQKTSSFSAGQTVKGGTSGATCVISADLIVDSTHGVLTCTTPTSFFSYGEDLIVNGTRYASMTTADNANAFGAGGVISTNTCSGAAIGIEIFNNTVFAYGSSGYLHLSGQDPCDSPVRYSGGNQVKNNIFYNLTTFSIDTNPSGAPNDIGYNLFGDIATNSYSMNAHDISNNTNPFTNSDAFDFTLQAASPAIRAGTPLSNYFTTDILGISRPQDTAWDIGAYEYVPGGDTTPPAPPTGLAVN